MGYSFSLLWLQYPKAGEAGSMMPLHMWWLNAGVAPIYRDFSLAAELRSAKTATIIRIPVDVQKWLPGDAVFDGTLYVPENLAEGPDRKSTRLNSSHVSISYAVFCL